MVGSPPPGAAPRWTAGAFFRKMARVELSPALQAVVRDLEACPEHTPATLAAALRRPITIDDVAPWIRFDAGNYIRSLVMRSERWELRLLCWRPGQTSSMHGHGSASCAFRILRGSAVESILGARDRVWAPGDVVEEASADLIHQVGNAGADPLLTLHAYSPPLAVDAPSPRAGRDVVIVGGGLSGVALAYHLLRSGGPDLRITMLERGPWLGRGIAYGVDSTVFRLNVPASKMSLDPARPGDFMEWADATATPHAFLPRTRYGAYVVERLGQALRESRAKLRLIRGEAVALEPDAVRLSDGTRVPAESVVLATGLAPRLAPAGLADDPRIIDAWDECSLAALPPTGRILILGAGLTALDVMATLQVRGFRGTATILSRRGLLPRPHHVPPSPATPLAPEVVAAAPRDLRGLLRWGRAVVRETEQRGEPWQHAIDAIRPHVSRLWRGLPPRDRARFVRSVRPYWEVLRHRAPHDAHLLVERWRAERKLDVLAGSVVSCVPGRRGLDVVLRLPGGARTERFDVIVRCIGPALERSEIDSPLVHDLLATGRAAADPAGLGIVTDEEGRVVGADGQPGEHLLALGALRRASSWETTAVPDISVHALALAKRLLARSG
jgi:uncharacterized NAD(P)/FAD-binding protein YdhS